MIRWGFHCPSPPPPETPPPTDPPEVPPPTDPPEVPPPVEPPKPLHPPRCRLLPRLPLPQAVFHYQRYRRLGLRLAG